MPGGKLIREVVETLALALIIFFIVHIGVQNFRVQGTSMFPTLQTGNLVLVDKVDYLLTSPARGDVVVFKAPPAPSQDYIKRIIGVPGDVVRVVAGAVYVNHRRLIEPYIVTPPAYSYGPKRVPKADYFVLGDNRNNSYDSHYWGWLPRGNIIGKAVISYWPFSRINLFSF